jgi:hypothetical protein
MADDIILIPINPTGPVFQANENITVRGGHARYVPMVPVGDDGTRLACIWKSHEIVQATLADGSKVPAYECLLLISRNPLTTIRAEVAADSWQHFGQGIVEW